jgi:molecular chaperone Hsp33
MPTSDLAIAEIRCYFVRRRNCLLVRGKFSDLYMDYYLHLMQHGLKHEGRLDTLLKEALTGLVLHLASRPQDEICAWTIHLHDPLLNLFVTGGSRPGRVTGRIFTEDVKDLGKSLFIAQTTRAGESPRQSTIEFPGSDVLAAIEHFYTQSEQRLTRYFRLSDEDFVQISAEPDADLAWLAGLKDTDLPVIDQTEQLSLLETRAYVFECGCSVDRLFPMLSRLPQEDLDAVFQDGHADITCPRCGAKFEAPLSVFLEWKAKQPA